jgi:polygalacturonase
VDAVKRFMTPTETTTHFQSLIDSAAASGGGRVEIPPGKHVCGSLELKSGVELHLCSGARLVAAEDPALFPARIRHEGKLTANDKCGALIFARDSLEAAISGFGTLDGGGDWDDCPDWKSAQSIFRPAVGYFEDCTGLRIEGVNIVGAKWWTLHLMRCHDTQIRGIRMRSNWPNSDGIDPDGCKRMIISDCHLVCGDDCIVLKSTAGDDCEDICVSNCILETPKACLKIGTESLGAFRNVSMANCVLKGDVAFGLYMKDGGLIENIQAANLLADMTAPYPILIDAMPRDYRDNKPAGQIRNISIHGVRMRGAGRIWLEGTEEQPLENISLSEIDWDITGPLPEKPEPKPLGSARVILDPARPPYETRSCHLIAVNVNDLHLGSIRLSGSGKDRELTHS